MCPKTFDDIQLDTPNPILTTSELDQIVPDYWREGYVDDPADLWWKECKSDCYISVWGTENSGLKIIVSKEENSTIAEDVILTSISRAEEQGGKRAEMERVDYLPDHTWFGTKDMGSFGYSYSILSQDQEYFIEVSNLSNINPDDELFAL